VFTKDAEGSIYKNAEIGKVESRNVFKEFDHGWHADQQHVAGFSQVPAL
jgi:hypothetical protein